MLGQGLIDIVLQEERGYLRLIQAALAKLEYDVGPIDGIVGDLTIGAVLSFQEDLGHEVTGFLTAEEFGELLRTSRVSPLDAMSDAQVEALREQRTIDTLGGFGLGIGSGIGTIFER